MTCKFWYSLQIQNFIQAWNAICVKISVLICFSFVKDNVNNLMRYSCPYILSGWIQSLYNLAGFLLSRGYETARFIFDQVVSFYSKMIGFIIKSITCQSQFSTTGMHHRILVNSNNFITFPARKLHQNYVQFLSELTEMLISDVTGGGGVTKVKNSNSIWVSYNIWNSTSQSHSFTIWNLICLLFMNSWNAQKGLLSSK